MKTWDFWRPDGFHTMRRVSPAKPAVVAGRGWMSHTLSEALKLLTADERAALLLRDVEQRPLDSVADQLGCSAQTARLHIATGRIKLLRYFETN
jgi:DNA-directed RNA polymerase specialized sigma24 family protein